MHYISSATQQRRQQHHHTFNTATISPSAAVDVQNRVASVTWPIAAAVQRGWISITKANSNFVFGSGSSPDNRYTNEFISNYLDVYVKDALKRVKGVGRCHDLWRTANMHAHLARSGQTRRAQPYRTDVVSALRSRCRGSAGAARSASLGQQADFSSSRSRCRATQAIPANSITSSSRTPPMASSFSRT